MAGVKGRSGGPRPNSGGPREGAGAKPKETVFAPPSDGMSPLEFLLWAQNQELVPLDLRIRAATAAAPYKHQKLGEGGKKDKEGDAAKDAAKGRFAPLTPPRLVASKS